MSLPLEIWCLIAERLESDKQSISRFCLSNTRTYVTLLPVLYDRIHLTHQSSISFFCSTIIGNPGKFAPLVRCLQVGDHFEPCEPPSCPRLEYSLMFRLHKNLALEFRSLLELLFNLRELYLTATPKALNVCLGDVKIPFKLRRLEIPSIASKPFCTFLQKQTLLTRLHLFSASQQFSNIVTNVLLRNSDFLPHIDALTGPLCFVNALASKRQLSEVIVSQEIPDLWESSIDEFLDRFPNLFNMQSLNSAGWFRCPSATEADPWPYMIASLKRHGAHRNVRIITVIDTPKIPETRFRPHHLQDRLALVNQNSGFDNLEMISIIWAHHEASSKKEIYSWLEEFQSLDTWIGYVPALKRVHVYGIDLE
ncbi:hypothetical protein FRC12_014452 [Ceratobasidium sp. 428]|nr:hypothetical protein FRC12_014452 [Ceratobasidium sp. 428]